MSHNLLPPSPAVAHKSVLILLSRILRGLPLPARTVELHATGGTFLHSSKFEKSTRAPINKLGDGRGHDENQSRSGSTHQVVSRDSKIFDEGRLSDAVEALERLVQGPSYVDNSLFYRVLKRCISQKNLVVGRRVHALAVKSGYESNAFLANHIIRLYSSHGMLQEATEVFSKVHVPSPYMWTSLILAYARHGKPAQALTLYRRMRAVTAHANLDNHLFVAVLTACAAAEDLSSGREVHDDIMRSAHEPNVFVGNCLVDMYAKCGSLEDARRVFDKLPIKNVVTWTAMISGYAQHGQGQEALSLYAVMQQEGVTTANVVTFVCLLQACANVGDLHHGKQLHAEIVERGLEGDEVIGTSLVHMYSKCGCLEDARIVFNSLPARDVVAWTAMIAAYAQNGLGQEALALYASMQQEGITLANHVTLLCLLQACGSVAGLEKGKEIHSLLSRTGLESTDLCVASTLIDMYGKCGSMIDAQQVFDALPSRDIVTWNALIAGYARQGESEVVFDLFGKVRHDGFQPDGVTFLGVLTACSHAGLVCKGQEYFEAMTRDYDIRPTSEHYSCMVDLLGRAGHVEEALKMVKTMPFQPHREVWRSLLSSCRKWKNVELGRQAFECAVSSDNDDPAMYVLMANIYAIAQMPEKSNEIQAMRVKAQVWKQPGQSWWTDMGGIVHTFIAGDKTHPDKQDIDVKLQELFVKMKKAGYVPHLDSVLRDLPDAEKEAALCGHSEKLAIAHALLKTPQGMTIRVVKNLRVCEDCHRATAFISKIEERTIICRDASRFHVYKEGKCSCGDYW